MKRLFLFIPVLFLFIACGNDVVNEPEEVEDVAEETVVEEQNNEDSVSEGELNTDVFDLVGEGRAFDAGIYEAGDIPEGEYAFIMYEENGHYYIEREPNGSTLDNENFESFGYVYVNEIGEVETTGLLIPIDEVEAIGATGAKQIYENVNNVSNYQGSAHYKVGADISPGEYVIESDDGIAYVAVKSGPVGNVDILENERFEGTTTITVEEGQYLDVSGGRIVE